MFLIRSAFWLSLIVLLLPTDPQQQAKVYHSASHAIGQAATFCDRNQSLCEQGTVYWATFRRKMEFGAKMVVDIASERLLGRPQGQQHAALPSPDAGTLLPGDLRPAWRGRAGA